MITIVFDPVAPISTKPTRVKPSDDKNPLYQFKSMWVTEYMTD